LAHDEETGRSAEALDKAALLWLCPLFFPSFCCHCCQNDQGQSKTETRKLTFADAALGVCVFLGGLVT
jgi:hypothetical protein